MTSPPRWTNASPESMGAELYEALYRVLCSPEARHSVGKYDFDPARKLIDKIQATIGWPLHGK